MSSKDLNNYLKLGIAEYRSAAFIDGKKLNYIDVLIEMLCDYTSDFIDVSSCVDELFIMFDLIDLKFSDKSKRNDFYKSYLEAISNYMGENMQTLVIFYENYLETDVIEINGVNSITVKYSSLVNLKDVVLELIEYIKNLHKKVKVK